MLQRVLMIASILLIGISTAEGGWPPRPVDPGVTWTTVFRLEPGVTYTYVLEGATTGGRHGRRGPRGELNLVRSHGFVDEIRFWYEIDGVRGSGTAAADARSVTGAVLLSALTAPESLSLDALRVLATPFHWVQWYELFAESTFRDGLVWQVFEHPPQRFTAERRGRSLEFSGQVTVGRDVVALITVDTSRPLPLTVESRYGRSRYEARLVVSPGRGPLR